MEIGKKIFLSIIFGVYLFIGMWALFIPESFALAVDLNVASLLGRSEIRAVYGGLNTMIAILSIYVCFKPKYLVSFLRGFSFYLFAILLGRLVSLCMLEMTHAHVIVFTAFEAVVVALCVYFLKKGSQSQ